MTTHRIIKLGTVDLDTVESNPIVFQGRLYRFEYIRQRYHANALHNSYFRFVDVEAGVAGRPFGVGLHMGNAFVWDNRVVVTAVEDWGKKHFYQLESEDLVTWTEPRVILTGDGWQGYNTSLCRAGDRFLLTFELGAPKELVGRPFTMFFAESTDLRNWTVLPDRHFDRDIYTGGPMLRWFNGWYYFFYLHAYAGDRGRNCYRQHVARSLDLLNWAWSKYNPILDFGPDDQRPGRGHFTPAQLEKLATADNINVSDLDMCEWQGGLYMVYSWGNQHGVEFLAEAKVENCTEQDFCESLF